MALVKMIHGGRMKHLIVVAHPNPSSFTHALVNAYARELSTMGHDFGNDRGDAANRD
jgi:putative NADPH-quinone reductase